jgi:Antitoxin VbhA
MSGPPQMDRRVKAVVAARRSTELDGSRSTAATRADQDDFARGIITAAELGARVRGRYDVQQLRPECPEDL